MADRELNVLIINAYSIENMGDRAIILCMIELIRCHVPNCKITVMSSYHEQNREYYSQHGITSVSTIWNLPEKPRSARYRKALGYFFSFNEQSTNLEAMKSADIVLSAGGGYLCSSRRVPLGLDFVGMAWHIRLASRLKKPCILFPQSIGPLFWRLDRLFVSRLLRSTTHVFSREPISTELVQSFGVSQLTECPDIVFTLQPSAAPEFDEMISTGSPKIGVSLMDWQSMIPQRSSADVNAYINRLAVTIMGLRRHFPKLHVYIFPHCHLRDASGAANDWDVSKKLLSKCQEMCTIVDVAGIKEPSRLAGLYSKMDAFIATRMHASIFAMCGGVPTIALAYQPKTVGTFRLLGLSESCMPVDSFSSTDLTEKIKHFLDGGTEYREQLSTALKRIRSQIQTKLVSTLSQSLRPVEQIDSNDRTQALVPSRRLEYQASSGVP